MQPWPVFLKDRPRRRRRPRPLLAEPLARPFASLFSAPSPYTSVQLGLGQFLLAVLSLPPVHEAASRGGAARPDAELGRDARQLGPARLVSRTGCLLRHRTFRRLV